MVFPRGFLKVVLSGPMLAGAEEWSTSLSLDLGGFTSDAGVEELLDEIVPIATRWFTDASSRIHTNASLDTIKANVIGVDGRYASSTYTGVRDITPVRGATNGQMLPPQCSVAVSLLTARKRGPGARGRFYPPLPVVTVNADGSVGESERAGIAGSAATMINALNGVSDLRVVVASEVGSGALVPVTSVAVGSIVDTQRRRRASLVETYSVAAVAP